MENDQVLNTRVPTDLLRHARQIAASRDETLSQIIRRALRAYVASGPAQLDLEVAARAPAPPTKPAAKSRRRGG